MRERVDLPWDTNFLFSKAVYVQFARYSGNSLSRTGWFHGCELYSDECRFISLNMNSASENEKAPNLQDLVQEHSPLQVLLENIPDVVYFKDRESRFVHFSKSLRQICRFPDSECVRGRTDADLFTPEHAKQALNDEREIVRTGSPMVGRLEKETHLDGRVTWALTTKMPWRDENGNIVGTFGISKDVTALVKAEEELAHEKQLLHTILDNVPDRIYFKDRGSRFLHFSKSLCDFHGATPEQLRGKSDADLFTEDHARAAFGDEQMIIETGQPIIGKLEKEIHPDSRVTWSLTSKMPWRGPNGEMIGTFGISKDITPIKEAEAEVERVHKRLVEASRLAGMAEVASSVLHNVGNALNSINVCCSLAIDGLKQWNLNNLARIPALLEEHAGHLDQFLTQDNRGKHIPEYIGALPRNFDQQKASWLNELEQLRARIDHVNQIVAMQQSYARVMGVEEDVAPSQLVEDALRMNFAALERHGVSVVREMKVVPHILVDKHKVLQILVNLIQNAKYALNDSGSTEKKIIVRLFAAGTDQIQIQIEDNGVGIAAENLTSIFAHGFTTRKDGHGFGLHSGALAAREMGGELSVHSDGLGKGALFTLCLPLKQTRR
jgi:PAS domain S-box-containing protein